MVGHVKTARSSAITPLVIFSHGNSFPSGTYSMVLRGLKSAGYAVACVDKFGHDPSYPVTSNWPHLVQQLADFIAMREKSHEGPVYLVGHSLGGILSLMCAARYPSIGGRELAGVVLLDSPVLSGWKARTLQVLKKTPLLERVSPGRISRQRRQRWPSRDAALAHFQGKRAFAKWHPQALADYIAHGTHEEVGSDGSVHCVLSFDREVETAIYNTLPHNLDRLLRRHPLRCPVAFIGGTFSREMKQVGLETTRRIIGVHHEQRMQFIEGGHLFPMEKPRETAAAIVALLKRLSNSAGAG